MRRYVFRILLASALAYLTYPAWGGILPHADPGEGIPVSSGNSALELGFRIAAKPSVGLFELMQLADTALPVDFDTIIGSDSDDGVSTGSIRLQQMRLILYDHIEMDEAAADARRALASLERTADSETADDDAGSLGVLLDRLYIEDLPLEDDELDLLVDDLGFLGSVAKLKSYRLAGDPRAEALHTSIVRQSMIRLVMVFLLAFGILVLGLIGVGLLIAFLRAVSKRTLRSRIQLDSVPPHLLWETFTFFMIFMVLAGELGHLIPSTSLVLAFAFELILPIIVCYPLLQGVRLTDLRNGTGMIAEDGWWREILIGPLGFAVSLPLRFVMVLLALLLVTGTESDLSQEINPLFDQLSEFSTVLILLFVVVIYPIVEEVMFRGVFYGALRTRFGPVSSIVASSLLFALIHPYQVIGFAYIFGIAVVLGALREWRGSLLAPIVTHMCVNASAMIITLGL